ncbi:MAG: sodium:proton antiporter [Rickettsiales bacterium]|nr:MAG: sodium:proton antiporter [Rickettsiales bacterium]
MALFINFIPILLFVGIFFGSGLYFSFMGVDNAFYQVPPTAAILPSIIVAWLMNRNLEKGAMPSFLDGARHPDIIIMCIIFLLAGALSSVTQAIGSVQSTVNFALSIINPEYLLIGFFIVSALISTAIGTSLGTVAALSSLMVELATKGAFSVEMGAATLVGGAIFGDNLSVISDTTIASVTSQGADLKEKLKLNVKLALPAAAVTIMIMLSIGGEVNITEAGGDYSLILILPYIVLITLAVMGISVFAVLIIALALAGAIGIIYADYSLIAYSQDISAGFHDMHEIMLLAILVGGLSGLSNHKAKAIVEALTKLLPKDAGRKSAELLIAFMVSVFDALLALNTVAIIFCGEFAKEISLKYKIKPHESAVWLDVFSCVIQGIIPYGAQILLVCAIAEISPLVVIGKVYYCYVLAGVTLSFILLRK